MTDEELIASFEDEMASENIVQYNPENFDRLIALARKGAAPPAPLSVDGTSQDFYDADGSDALPAPLEGVVERVARALCEADNENPDDVLNLAGGKHFRWRLRQHAARAAIAAASGEPKP